MNKFTLGLAAGAMTALSGSVAFAEEITVGYFLEWPMPFLAAKASGAYDEALGMKVNWVSFETGTAMSAAMASGDVQLSVSQGVPPFVVATSGGQDIQIVDVAVSYSENDNCVVRSDLEIDKTSAAELAGKKVAVPLGTAAHYGFLRQMAHFSVDLSTLDVVDMAPPEGAAALAQSAVDMSCGWGGSLQRMKESGNILLTGAEKQELGILVFDVTTGPASYIAENGDVVAQFVKVTSDANAEWNANHSEEMLAVIAQQSGMDIEATRSSMLALNFQPLTNNCQKHGWAGTLDPS